MSKLAKRYFKTHYPMAKKVKRANFKYADLGSCHSYVSFTAEVDGEFVSKQMSVGEFFIWLGEEIF